MAYPSNSDGVAQDQIKAFVDRILRMKEEERAIKADIREIYAEAKGNGFDKTILGKLVNYVEKRSTKGAELAEGEAIFDLYLAAYDGASRKTGTDRATHTHEASWRPPSEAEVAAAQSQANASTGNAATEQALEAPADSGAGEASRASDGAGTVAINLQDGAESAPSLPAGITDLTSGLRRNSRGLPVADGCQRPEHCAGSWRQRCYSCEKAFAAAHAEGVAL